MQNQRKSFKLNKTYSVRWAIFEKTVSVENHLNIRKKERQKRKGKVKEIVSFSEQKPELVS